MSPTRVETAFALIMFVAVACGEKSGTVDLVKTVASEARTKPRVIASIKMNSDQAAASDLALLKSIEDRIEEAHIGRLISSGSNAGFLTLTIEVDNTADAITRLRQVMTASGVSNRASFRVSAGESSQ